MLYREAGQFKTSYRADQAVFPIRQDQIGIIVLLAVLFIVVPLWFNDFMLSSVMIPTLIFALAAIGLNILTGFAGQLSLGTGGFMGVGAFAYYKLITIDPVSWLLNSIALGPVASFFDEFSVVFYLIVSGLFAAAVGLVFGIPSLRVKGFYLAVATLASQFFLEWCFGRIPWLYNYNASGAIEVPNQYLFGIAVTGPLASAEARYLVVLAFVVVLTLVASNLVRGHFGRAWMAVRDMDIAAELMGIRLLPTKLLAFSISSYFAGVAGAMMVFMWLGAAEVASFDINVSFQILFMVIIGGLGSLMGSFLGAAFIWNLPILLRAIPKFFGMDLNAATVEHIQFMIVGGMIIFFLIVEPNGFARLWQITKEKLRRWPFPY